MLKAHMDARENALVAISHVPANAGHSLHKGTPREAFVREFLESHLPANVAIGTGEIIDASSVPGGQRNQFDIVLYRQTYPKLAFGGGIHGFLVESVIATIEVKSTLTEAELEAAMRAAQASKALTPNTVRLISAGYIPPRVLNYVVAYGGPSSMETVYRWLPRIHTRLGIRSVQLSTNPEERAKTPSPSIDGVFILQKGFVYFDNVPSGFATEEMRQRDPDIRWVFANTTTGNLLLLFLFLQSATANLDGGWFNPLPYLEQFRLSGVGLGKD